MVTGEKLLTVDEFWGQYAGQPFELIAGSVVKMAPTGYVHGSVTRRVLSFLGAFTD